jgi:hypothetical protein
MARVNEGRVDSGRRMSASVERSARCEVRSGRASPSVTWLGSKALMLVAPTGRALPLLVPVEESNLDLRFTKLLTPFQINCLREIQILSMLRNAATCRKLGPCSYPQLRRTTWLQRETKGRRSKSLPRSTGAPDARLTAGCRRSRALQGPHIAVTHCSSGAPTGIKPSTSNGSGHPRSLGKFPGMKLTPRASGPLPSCTTHPSMVCWRWRSAGRRFRRCANSDDDLEPWAIAHRKWGAAPSSASSRYRRSTDKPLTELNAWVIESGVATAQGRHRRPHG